ncbi:hypothetical protein D3C80_1358700 [compost metagenome]
MDFVCSVSVAPIRWDIPSKRWLRCWLSSDCRFDNVSVSAEIRPCNSACVRNSSLTSPRASSLRLEKRIETKTGKAIESNSRHTRTAPAETCMPPTVNIVMPSAGKSMFMADRNRIRCCLEDQNKNKCRVYLAYGINWSCFSKFERTVDVIDD